MLSVALKIQGPIPKIFAADMASSLDPVQLIRAQDAQFLCQGLVWDQDTIVFPRHCFAQIDKSAYKVLVPSLRSPLDLRDLVFFQDDPRYFPSLDIALVKLEVKVPKSTLPHVLPADKLKRGDQLIAKSWRFDPSCAKSSCSSKLEATKLEVKELVEGFRIKHLLLADVKSAQDLCYGDSGSPVYKVERGRISLVGILTGRWYPYSPSSLRCGPEGHLVTLMAPYASWLNYQNRPAHPLNGEAKTFLTLGQACRESVWESAQWMTVQGILYRLLLAERSAVDQSSLRKIFSDCNNVDERWQRFLVSKKKLEFDFGPDFTGLLFMFKLEHLKVASLTSKSVQNISQLGQLKSLLINGADDDFDFGALGTLKRLESLEIRHVNRPRSLSNLFAQLPALKTLNLFDVKLADELNFKELSQSYPNVHIEWERVSGSQSPPQGILGP